MIDSLRVPRSGKAITIPRSATARMFRAVDAVGDVNGMSVNVSDDAWIPLAEVGRPHGVRGELRLRLFNKASNTLLDQEEVLVRFPDGEEHEVSVEKARRADDAILMKLYSVDDREKAEELRGAQICVRRKDFPEAEEGEFYAIDVVGSEVRLAGARIGVVGEIVTYPTVDTMLVRADDGEGDWEFPLTDVYVGKVDVPNKIVELLTLDDVERIGKKKAKPKPEAPLRKWQKKQEPKTDEPKE